MSELPDAEHLLTLLAVAEAGNESAAAELLGVGQSSVSRRLAALQQRSAAQLTQRTAAGTRLTPAGAALLPYAREVREALRSAARLLGPADGIPLRVSLGVSPHLLPRLAGALAGAGSAAEPLELQVSEAGSTDLLAAVRAGRLGAALTLWAPAGTEPGLSAARLGSDRAVLVAPPGHAAVANGRPDPAALRDARLLLPGASTLTERGRSFAREAGVGEARLVELSGPAAVRSAVLAGEGVGVTLASYVAAEVAAGWLAQAPARLEAVSGASGAAGVAVAPRGAEAPERTGADADRLGVWLLVADVVPEEAARRLTELVRAATEASEPR